VLVQFWEDARAVPVDIQACLYSWARLETAGFERLLCDDASAQHFIGEQGGRADLIRQRQPDHSRAFAGAPGTGDPPSPRRERDEPGHLVANRAGNLTAGLVAHAVRLKADGQVLGLELLTIGTQSLSASGRPPTEPTFANGGTGAAAKRRQDAHE